MMQEKYRLGGRKKTPTSLALVGWLHRMNTRAALIKWPDKAYLSINAYLRRMNLKSNKNGTGRNQRN